MKRVLMIAFHFPPMSGSSGIQRTLRFVQHLPHVGWLPLVLSAHPRAYESTSADLLGDVPAEAVVRRAFALDTARHLTFRGRYLGWMARPDRWVSWRFDALRVGLRMVREFRPDVIWSTYPIATAHRIGHALHRRTGIPWIADFRDPMAQDGYPADPLTWQSYARIEAAALRHAQHAVFTTPGAARMYRQRYPQAAERIVVVENGYDEESFAGLAATSGAGGSPPVSAGPRPEATEPRSAATEPRSTSPVVLLHSGAVYPSERDPTQLFIALARLQASGRIRPGELRIRFRAPVHEQLLTDLAAEHGVQAYVEVCPALGYRPALAEMLAADALLVMQAANCNAQIPAKIYEYLRAGRPIIALTDAAGDTADVLARAGVDTIAALDSAAAIEALLPRFLAAVRERRAPLPSASAVQRASRRGRCDALAALLDGACRAPARADLAHAAAGPPP